MIQNKHIGRWRKERLSKRKRDELSRFNLALYGKDNQMPAKKSTAVANPTAEFKYVDADGIEQTIDLEQVKNLGETAYAESQQLFPNAKQCFVGKTGEKFDKDGRENILNQNIVVLSAVRMNAGDYGPGFLVQAMHPEFGEITAFAPGDIAKDAIAAMSGISLESGDRVGPSELPVWCRFEFVPGAGQHKNGYFVILPALQQADAVQVK